MRDIVTFSVGVLCFLVAGAVFTFEDTRVQRPAVKRVGAKRDGSERTTRENRTKDDRAAS
jgi:hypothetical protein